MGELVDVGHPFSGPALYFLSCRNIVFVRYGLYACTHISRCGLINAPYSVTKDCLSMCLNDLFTISRDCMAFFEAFWPACNGMHNAY